MRTEDGYIIQQCLDGDAAAFGFLVEKYKKAIYGLAYSRVGNFHDAQDITQEVLIKAYQELRTLKRWDNFMGWLYRITANQCNNWIRSESRRPDGEFAEDQESHIVDRLAVDSYRENMVYESVREALDSLPEIYREVMTLQCFSGMTIKEMAGFIGVSPNTIDRRLKEARIRLKEEMLIMMSATYEQQELPVTFTFRIIEMVKRIRINAVPRSAGLPWGLSLAAGIVVAAMSLSSQLVIHELPKSPTFPSETALKAREISVDILREPQIFAMAGKRGDVDGSEIDPQNLQNALPMNPNSECGIWTREADMPTARRLHGTGVVDGKIYVIGGVPVQPGATAVVEEYDPAADTWTKRANMPTSRQACAVAVVNGTIYAIGGNSGGDNGEVCLSTVEAYNPATDKWIQKADMPTPRMGTSAAAVDGKIYVVGGLSNKTPLSTVEVYNPATDKWTKKADMPTARWSSAACVVDGRIYVSGGATEWNSPYAIVPTVEVYNPAANTWDQIGDMPMARAFHSTSIVDEKIYVIGGMLLSEMPVSDGNTLSTVDMYDPATGTWMIGADLLTARAHHGASVVDRKIYAIGGYAGSGTSSLSVVEKYDLAWPDGALGARLAAKSFTAR